MKMQNNPVTIVCMYNRAGDIEPVKYRIKEEGKAKTYSIVEVIDVRYGKYCGDTSISYSCKANVEGELVDSIVRFNIDEGCWQLYQ